MSAVSSGLKAARREFRTRPSDTVQLNQLQQRFVEWNAERLGITIENSRNRFETSVNRFKGGHSGPDFRQYNVVSHDVFLPFFSDEEEELYPSYEFHSRMHFLRMLSYARYAPDDAAHQMIDSFDHTQKVTILDFGCGLAQRSRWIAESLQQKGCSVSLSLADIPTQRKDFLVWLCARDGIEMSFLECTQSKPIPELPETIDVCVATEFFRARQRPDRVLQSVQ